MGRTLRLWFLAAAAFVLTSCAGSAIPTPPPADPPLAGLVGSAQLSEIPLGSVPDARRKKFALVLTNKRALDAFDKLMARTLGG